MACDGCSNGCNDCGGLTCGEGAAGLNGLNSFTETTSDFTQPNVGSNVTIDVSALGQLTGTFAKVGQPIYIQGGGIYTVVSSTSTTITVTNTGATVNVASGTNVPFPAGVSPSGTSGASGTPGSAGADGTTIIVKSYNNAVSTSSSYASVAGTHQLDSDTLDTIGDTLRVKAWLHGEPGGDPTDNYLYEFKFRIGGVDINYASFINPLSVASIYSYYTASGVSTMTLTGVMVEFDLVVVDLSPFTLLSIGKGRGISITSGNSYYTVSGNSGFAVPETHTSFHRESFLLPMDNTTGAYTLGIDPTVNNDIEIHGRMTQNGSGIVDPGFAVPYFHVELLKKK